MLQPYCSCAMCVLHPETNFYQQQPLQCRKSSKFWHHLQNHVWRESWMQALWRRFQVLLNIYTIKAHLNIIQGHHHRPKASSQMQACEKIGTAPGLCRLQGALQVPKVFYVFVKWTFLGRTMRWLLSIVQGAVHIAGPG